MGSFDRATAVRRLADERFDVLVVGGGVTGAGVALDAASRGLKTALVERDDFASGTSSKSSKLVHGGLRYLQNGDVRLVYRALAERQRLRRNAPHLVKLMPFLIPLFTGRDALLNRKLARALGSAMWMYDLTGGARIGKLHRRLTTAQAMSYMPTLAEDRIAGAYLYYDATADDARLTLTIARTAAVDFDAVVANRCQVVGFRRNSGGHTDGAEIDADGARFVLRARSIVNATGVWSDELRALDEGAHPHTLRPAKGVHLTVPWTKVRNQVAAVVPVPKDRRSVFVVPWGELTYIGTTDTDYDGPLDDPQCTADDIRYLLGAFNRSVTSPLSEADIVGTWAGLRPLVRTAPTGRTADLSRRHLVTRSAGGVVTVTGGKLTTYREMAADTMAVVVDVLGDRAPRGTGRSRTAGLRLLGAAGYDQLRNGSTDVHTRHLADRYGGETREILALVDLDPSLGDPLVVGLPYLRAEAVFAVRHEMAGTLDDILSRRTRARLLARDASVTAAPAIAALVGPELGWDEQVQSQQVAAYASSVDHERLAVNPTVATAEVERGSAS